MSPFPRHLLRDEPLARLAADGDGPAFDVLFGRYRTQLLRCSRSIVRNDHDAQDVVQSTALKALAGCRDDATAFRSPWLFRIAYNEAISLLRTRRARPAAELEQTIAHPEPGPAQQALQRRATGAIDDPTSSPTASARRCCCASSTASATRRSPTSCTRRRRRETHRVDGARQSHRVRPWPRCRLRRPADAGGRGSPRDARSPCAPTCARASRASARGTAAPRHAARPPSFPCRSGSCGRRGCWLPGRGISDAWRAGDGHRRRRCGDCGRARRRLPAPHRLERRGRERARRSRPSVSTPARTRRPRRTQASPGAAPAATTTATAPTCIAAVAHHAAAATSATASHRIAASSPAAATAQRSGRGTAGGAARWDRCLRRTTRRARKTGPRSITRRATPRRATHGRSCPHDRARSHERPAETSDPSRNAWSHFRRSMMRRPPRAANRPTPVLSAIPAPYRRPLAPQVGGSSGAYGFLR